MPAAAECPVTFGYCFYRWKARLWGWWGSSCTAGAGGRLAGCLRILTDGCFFGTITELLVLPAYQRRGVGSRLLRLAGENTPTLLYFGAQPEAEAFYEKNGCRRSLTAFELRPGSLQQQ